MLGGSSLGSSEAQALSASAVKKSMPLAAHDRCMAFERDRTWTTWQAGVSAKSCIDAA